VPKPRCCLIRSHVRPATAVMTVVSAGREVGPGVG
jgi:hypothetical protein